MGLTSSSSCISSAHEYIEPIFKNGGNKSVGGGADTPLTASHFHKATKVADYQFNTATFLSPYPSTESLPSSASLAATSDEGAVKEVMEKEPPQRPRTFTLDSSDEVRLFPNRSPDILWLTDYTR